MSPSSQREREREKEKMDDEKRKKKQRNCVESWRDVSNGAIATRIAIMNDPRGVIKFMI